jgi:RHS repeat-associated protein
MTPARQLLGFLLVASTTMAVAQTNTQNYVLTRTYKTRGATEASNGTYSGDPSTVSTQINYYDGLGKLRQQVSAFASPKENRDVVVRTDYDNQHRPERAYLPIVNNGAGKGEYVGDFGGSSFYNSQVCGSTSEYFTLTHYDGSPLNRIVEQQAPGVRGNEAGVVTKYLVADGSIKRYKVSGINLTDIAPDGQYPGGALTYTETLDEDDHKVQEYRDRHDRVVLRRSFDGGTEFSTYYVYDAKGQLRAVLQPAYQAEASLPKYAFLYRYDAQGRMVQKKVPGADAVSMEYDDRDRMTFMTDGRGKKFYYLYENDLNRLTETGICTNGDCSGKTSLTRTRYDDYSGAFRAFVREDFSEWVNAGADYFLPTDLSRSLKGQTTVIWHRVIGSAENSYGAELQTVTYYDDKYRVVQIIRQLVGPGANAQERTSYLRDFTGKVLRERVEQITNGNVYALEKSFFYDQTDRLTKTTHRILESQNGSLVEKKSYTHAEQTYDEVGQLKTKKLHGGLQTLTYQHHVRGWLCEQKYETGPRFRVKLNYAASGNINSMDWATQNYESGQSFTYDGLSRLKTAQGSGNFQGFGESLSYDGNGNITGLTRQRNGGTIDNLTYSYNGNRVTRIDDAQDNADGFNDDNTKTDNEFAYDGNGNQTTDLNRKWGLSYNVLNLIREVTKNGSTPLQYTYDGAGGKRQVQAPAPAGTTTYEGAFEYGGNNALTRIVVEEGQVIRNADGTYTVNYYLRDHLGNVRQVMDENGAVMQQTEYYAFGLAVERQNSTSPPNKYLFNGKEKQEVTSFLDYGARQYDPITGRWLGVDPLAEKGRKWSPYVFAFNNPVRFLDPDGLFPGDPPRSKVRVYTETEGVGHTFVSVGTGSNTTVYTFGRYAGTDKNKSIGQSLSPTGPGVLVKMTGTEARDYIMSIVQERNGKAFEINNADGNKVSEFFENKLTSSSEKPAKGMYSDDETKNNSEIQSRVIGDYNITSNNCTTISCQAIRETVSDFGNTPSRLDILAPSKMSRPEFLPADFQKLLGSSTQVRPLNYDALKKEYKFPSGGGGSY